MLAKDDGCAKARQTIHQFSFVFGFVHHLLSLEQSIIRGNGGGSGVSIDAQV